MLIKHFFSSATYYMRSFHAPNANYSAIYYKVIVYFGYSTLMHGEFLFHSTQNLLLNLLVVKNITN